MRIIHFGLIFISLFGVKLFASESHSAQLEKQYFDGGIMMHYSVSGNFDEIKELLKISIADRGIKISNTSYISNMLQRTREVVGAEKDVFVSAEAIEFCSATLSRSMMEALPHSIIFCPYIIYIYVLAEQPDVVNLAFRKLPVMGSVELKTALKEVNHLLDDIIKETID